VRWLWLTLPLAASVALLTGCTGGDNADLRERLEKLEAENKALKGTVEKLSGELRPLLKRVHDLDVQNRNLEKTLAQAEQDLRSRISEMIQQERSGRRQRFVRPVPKLPDKPQPAPPPKPYMGFDGQTVTPEVAEQLKLKTRTGVLVTAVRDGTPAAIAGLRKEDVVVRFGDADVKTKQELVAELLKHKPGEAIAVAAWRGGERVELKIKLGER